jgi:hypothetical protein
VIETALPARRSVAQNRPVGLRRAVQVRSELSPRMEKRVLELDLPPSIQLVMPGGTHETIR